MRYKGYELALGKVGTLNFDKQLGVCNGNRSIIAQAVEEREVDL